jgi:protein TonB
MTRISTRASGVAATAAVHVALAALLLAGWQVTRQIAPKKPIIIVDRPAPPQTPLTDPIVTTTDLPVDVVLNQPVWDQTPDPVVRADPGPADPGPQTVAGGQGEPVVTSPPPALPGPSRIARLRGGEAMQPPYPPASRALDEEGSVTLAVSIAADGRVSAVSLLRSSGFARLDKAALDFALRRWRFEPALDNGKPVASTRNFTVRFSLENSR